MANETWKQVERRVAERLGGDRVGPTGLASPDVVAGWLAVEVKHRAKLPQWLSQALEQARANAGDRLGLVVLHEKGRHRSMVLLDLDDFADWFGEVWADA